MSQKPRPPTAKRSPSILVTDARNHPGKPAPFAGASGRRQPASSTSTSPTAPRPGPTSSLTSSTGPGATSGSGNVPNNYVQGRSSLDGSPYAPVPSGAPMAQSQTYPIQQQQQQQSPQQSQSRMRTSSMNKRFGNITIDKILSDVSDIPSAQSRSPVSPYYQHHQRHHHGVSQGSSPSSYGYQYNANILHNPSISTIHNAMGGGGSYMHTPHSHFVGGSSSSGSNNISSAQSRQGYSLNSGTSGKSGRGSSSAAPSVPPHRPLKGNGMPGRKHVPPRLTQNLPPRTTKVSEKLVLIPESPQPEFKFEDDENDNSPPPDEDDDDDEDAGAVSWTHEMRERTDDDSSSAFSRQTSSRTAASSTRQNRKTYAERLPKERRADKFPRVTAYCISDSIRIVAAASFLRENHKIRPRIYNEALYAPYYLPLLPGDEDNRVKSSPGGIQQLEQMINRSEQLDHHYEYYSALEGHREDDERRNGHGGNEDGSGANDRGDGSGHSGDNSGDMGDGNHWSSPDFDPSEPQDFSPPSNFLQSHMGSSNNSTKDSSEAPSPNNGKLATDEDAATTLINGSGNETTEQGLIKQGNGEMEREELISIGETSNGMNLESDNRVDDSQFGGGVNGNLNEVPEDPFDDTFDALLNNKDAGVILETNDDASKEQTKEEVVVSPETVTSQNERPVSRSSQKALDVADISKHAEVFIFSYGVVVFWNFSEHQEKEILADLTFARVPESEGLLPKSLIVRPIPQQDIETEELHFTYLRSTVKPRIYNDMITLRSGDHMTKLSMSHAIAQSTKLSRFEARMDGNMHDVRHVPKMLALTGQLGLKREEVLKISGKLFKLRVDVNLSSNVLDTPDFFWEDEPSLNPLYTAVREYLEIEPRILVLNERCMVFLQLTEILTDSIAEYNMSRITWIIIILIALSLAVSTLEIAVRFVILHQGVHGA